MSGAEQDGSRVVERASVGPACKTPPAAEALRIEALSVRYGNRLVLDRLDLPPLAPGEVTVMLGPNATGKSTALKAMAGLVPYSGSIRLGGRDLAALTAAERAGLIGFMPQNLPPMAGMSVLEGVIAAAGTGWFPGADPAARGFAALERLGIASLALNPLSRLSGGQRQLASLAQAIVRDPHLLLLDEPTSALDPARSHEMMSALRDLAGDGRIVLVVLHDLALAAQWADRLLVLHGGHLHAAGPPDQVLTPGLLAEVYGVEARVERCSRGRLVIQIDGLTGRGASA